MKCKDTAATYKGPLLLSLCARSSSDNCAVCKCSHMQIYIFVGVGGCRGSRGPPESSSLTASRTKLFLILVFLLLMPRSLLPEGRGENRVCVGRVGSFRMQQARFDVRGGGSAPLQSLFLCRQAAAVPHDDAGGQDALRHTSVKGGQD